MNSAIGWGIYIYIYPNVISTKLKPNKTLITKIYSDRNYEIENRKL